MPRRKNVVWDIPENCYTWEQANTAVLMDIRDELQELNRSVRSGRVADAICAIVRSGHTIDRLDARVARKIKLR